MVLSLPGFSPMCYTPAKNGILNNP